MNAILIALSSIGFITAFAVHPPHWISYATASVVFLCIAVDICVITFRFHAKQSETQCQKEMIYRIEHSNGADRAEAVFALVYFTLRES